MKNLKRILPMVLTFSILLAAGTVFAETVTNTTSPPPVTTSATTEPMTTASTEATTTANTEATTTANTEATTTANTEATTTANTEATTTANTQPATVPESTGTINGLPEFMIIEELEVPRGPLTGQGAAYLTGYPSGEFKPDVAITCAEALTMLVRAYALPTSDAKDMLNPLKVQHWASWCLSYLHDSKWVKQLNTPINQVTFYQMLNHVAAIRAKNPADLLAAPKVYVPIKPPTSNVSDTKIFITRASAVQTINLALNLKPNADLIKLKGPVLFKDVAKTHPCYGDIVVGTVGK